MRKSILLSIVFIAIFFVSCDAQTNQKPALAETNNGDVEVYYFHMTIRCVTCKTIEAEARKDIEMLYPEQFKSGKITFTALNIEEPAGQITGERMGVNSQALLIVKGDQKFNITNEGFLYAVSKPQKFAEVMKSKIDPLIIK
jgi:hypothetical protein